MCLMCALNSWFFCLYFSSVPPHLTFLNSCFSSTRDWTQGKCRGLHFCSQFCFYFLLRQDLCSCSTFLPQPLNQNYRCVLQHPSAQITDACYNTPGCQDCRCMPPHTWLLRLQVHATIHLAARTAGACCHTWVAPNICFSVLSRSPQNVDFQFFICDFQFKFYFMCLYVYVFFAGQATLIISY